MSYIIGLTRGGGTWTPRFLLSIDSEECIGCGACNKICGTGAQNHAPLPAA